MKKNKNKYWNNCKSQCNKIGINGFLQNGIYQYNTKHLNTIK